MLLQELIEVELLQVGDCLAIKPGAKIPTDGVVVQGITHCNEAITTYDPAWVDRLLVDGVLMVCNIICEVMTIGKRLHGACMHAMFAHVLTLYAWQAMITGEPLPVLKEVGAKMVGGSHQRNAHIHTQHECMNK